MRIYHIGNKRYDQRRAVRASDFPSLWLRFLLAIREDKSRTRLFEARNHKHALKALKFEEVEHTIRFHLTTYLTT